ncbi:MAG: hypothetical protein ACFFDW_01445 [Candidatus Thorarchaeota archaeon]
MAEVQQKMRATLMGQLITPMITPKTFIKKGDYWIRIYRDTGRTRYPVYSPVGKMIKGEYKPPVVLKAFRGYVFVSCIGNDKEKLLEKMTSFMKKTNLGGNITEGYGRVKWLECEVEGFTSRKIVPKKMFKIRKGLGPQIPHLLSKSLIVLMLHDFVHTEKHPSKIYQQINIENEEIRDACLNHHNGNGYDDSLLRVVKHYDSLAAYISRKKLTKTISRYDKENGELDFQKIVDEIEKRQYSSYKLYNYIYQSKELARVVEAMDYGKNSLRKHLLLMVNLAINDYHDGKLKIINNKISIERKSYKEEVSQSAKQKDEVLKHAKDAETHRSLAMNNANPERATTLKKGRLGA